MKIDKEIKLPKASFTVPSLGWLNSSRMTKDSLASEGNRRFMLQICDDKYSLKLDRKVAVYWRTKHKYGDSPNMLNQVSTGQGHDCVDDSEWESHQTHLPDPQATGHKWLQENREWRQNKMHYFFLDKEFVSAFILVTDMQ